MKILFLDFDGVLVTEQAYFYWGRWDEDGQTRPSEIDAKRCCPIAISNLNYLCAHVPDLKIVISSTWRKYHSLENIKTLLTEDSFNYADRVIDVTPVQKVKRNDFMFTGRGDEIVEWVKNHPDVEDWVAVDDHPFDILIEDDQKEDHLVVTVQEDGLNIHLVYNIVQRFNPKWQRPLFLM